MKEAPLVSIQCLVYNHEQYLRKCLDGFVMQKTSFKFEAIVHDDVSTDGSAAIIREYAEKYPDIIVPIYETENQYTKDDGSLDRIMDEACRGAYIALCEGDDYWLDPLKLQKQVDFLEKHKDFSMCFTKSKILRESGIRNKYELLYKDLKAKEYSGDEMLKSWTVPTATVLYRNYKEHAPVDKRFHYTDIILYLWLAGKGKIFCLDDETSVYRMNLGGMTQSGPAIQKRLDHYDAINECFNYKYDHLVKEFKRKIYVEKFVKGKFGKASLNVLKIEKASGDNMSLFYRDIILALFKRLTIKIDKILKTFRK